MQAGTVDTMRVQTLAKQLGLLIRQLRIAAGFSQEEFAFRCGVHRTYIGSIERGEKAMTIVTAAKVAHGLGLSLSELIQKLEKSQVNDDNEGEVSER